MKYDDGINELNRLFQVVQHHPSFRHEIRAMDRLLKAEWSLNVSMARPIIT
jgi:hypothetical protein